jgi:tRNA threonylcarbamoyladenosine biosynthesis protein TsaE
MKIISGSVKDTMALGAEIAKSANPGDIICLYGNLGSGKTVLAKGIAKGLGVDPDSVISPTFVILRPYDTRPQLYHFDFYRLASIKDMELLGLEEYLYSNAISVIEWPERMGKLLPKEFLMVKLDIKSGNTRRLTIKGKGKSYSAAAKKIYANIRN